MFSYHVTGQSQICSSEFYLLIENSEAAVRMLLSDGMSSCSFISKAKSRTHKFTVTLKRHARVLLHITFRSLHGTNTIHNERYESKRGKIFRMENVRENFTFSFQLLLLFEHPRPTGWEAHENNYCVSAVTLDTWTVLVASKLLARSTTLSVDFLICQLFFCEIRKYPRKKKNLIAYFSVALKTFFVEWIIETLVNDQYEKRN